MLCLLALYLFGALSFSARAEGGLEVHFLEQGAHQDAILIRCDGEDAFIDGGFAFKYDTVERYLRREGVSNLKYYICSHLHDNHIGCAGPIVADFRAEAILATHDTVLAALRQYCATMPAEKIAAVNDTPCRYVAFGDTFSIGSARVDVVGPIALYRRMKPYGKERYRYENLNSMILKLTYGDTVFLLTGDTKPLVLEDIERRHPGILKADVLKNPHHYDTQTEAVLDAISPSICVFSTGGRDFPTAAYLASLKARGVRCYNNAESQQGDIVVTSDGNALSVACANTSHFAQLKETNLALYEGQSARLTLQKAGAYHGFAPRYSSEAPSVATVSQSGIVTAVGCGETTILAQGDELCAMDSRVTVTVLEATVTFREREVRLRGTQKKALSLVTAPKKAKKNRALSYVSSDPSVVTVTEKGVARGVSEGRATVSLCLGDRVLDTCEVIVTDVAAKSLSLRGKSAVRVASSIRLTASPKPAGAVLGALQWTSSNDTIAAVDGSGMVTGISPGSAVITCETAGGIRASKRISVRGRRPLRRFDIVPKKPTLYLGADESLRLRAVTNPLTPVAVEVAWSSSDPSVATVDEDGVVVPCAVGRTTVTAKPKVGAARKAVVLVVENRFLRKRPVRERGALSTSAKQMVYENGLLLIDMYFANGTKAALDIPTGDLLRITVPTGFTRAVRADLLGAGRPLDGGATAVLRFAVALSEYPELKNLPLPLCDCTTVN
ncbi:MAG: Ig-like domain-containing protein [Christensenellales bacterium]